MTSTAPQLPALVIFDNDGVLSDTEKISCEVFSECLAEFDIRLSPEACDALFRGRSLSDCVKLIEARSERSLPEHFLRVLDQRTFSRFRLGLQPVLGMPAQLERLSQIGIPVCVASSGSHEKIRLTLELTGLLAYFEGHLYSASEVSRGKPAPDLFLYAAQREAEVRSLAAAPRQILVVEDSLNGVKAARAAGFETIAYLVAHEQVPEELLTELQALGARLALSPEELGRAFEDLLGL